MGWLIKGSETNAWTPLLKWAFSQQQDLKNIQGTATPPETLSLCSSEGSEERWPKSSLVRVQFSIPDAPAMCYLHCVQSKPLWKLESKGD